MWKKGKRYGDDSGAQYSAPPAKFAKANSDDDSGDIVVCELSKSRRVTVRNWQGKIVVDIREFYTKDGKELPGKKDVLAMHSTFLYYSKLKLTKYLLRFEPLREENIVNFYIFFFQFHKLEYLRITNNNNYSLILCFIPLQAGISLPLDQWEVLRDHIEEINKALKENA